MTTGMTKILTLSTLIASGLAAPAWTQDRAAPGILLDGCAPVLTVHKNSCVVETLYTCEGRADYNTILLHDGADGDSSVEGYTDDGLLVFTGPLDGTYWFELVETQDGLDLSTLLGDGVDTFEQSLTFNLPGLDSQPAIFKGTMFTIGETAEIDGLTFEIGRSDYSFVVGETEDTEVRHINTVYFHPDYPFVLTGTVESRTADTTSVQDQTPQRIVLPGQAGFGARQPLFGCGDFG